MSWVALCEHFNALENKVGSGNVSLNDLLNDDNLIHALGQQLTNLTNYIVSNVKSLIEIGIGLDEPADGIEIKRYLKVLTSHSTKLTDVLTSDVEIVNFIANSISKNINYANYFIIIQHAVDSGDFLSVIKNADEFFVALIDRIKNSFVFQFLMTLCTRRCQSIIDWLSKVNAEQILMDKINGDEKTAVSCLKLINCIMSATEHNILVNRLSTVEKFNVVMAAGIDAPTVEIAELSFRILILMINLSDDTGSDNNDSQLIRILDSLDLHCQKLCNIFFMNDDFFGDKFNALELIRTIINNRDSVDQCVIDVAKIMFRSFFNHPTNSFLHRSVQYLIKSIIKLETGWKEYIEEERILDKLMLEHNSQNQVTTTYHGFIISMSNDLNGLVISGKVDCPEGWKTFMSDIVEPTIKKYDIHYGGRLPKINTAMQERNIATQFIDEVPIYEDDDDDDFVDVSDSSDEEQKSSEADRNSK